MVLQSLMGAAIPVLVYLLSRMVIGRTDVALLAGIWSSLDQALIMLSSILGQEAFYLPLLTCLIFLLTRYNKVVSGGASFLNTLLIGIVFGLSAVVRSAI